MRILHLNDHGSSVGGVEDYIREVACALQDEGHSSLLIYFIPNNTDSLIPEATCIPMAAWPDKAGQAIHRIEEVIAAFRPDVAYVHAVYHPDLMKWLGQRLPSVAYVHAPYPVCPGSAQTLAPKFSRLPTYGGGDLFVQRPDRALLLGTRSAETCAAPGTGARLHLRLSVYGRHPGRQRLHAPIVGSRWHCRRGNSYSCRQFC